MTTQKEGELSFLKNLPINATMKPNRIEPLMIDKQIKEETLDWLVLLQRYSRMNGALHYMRIG